MVWRYATRYTGATQPWIQPRGWILVLICDIFQGTAGCARTGMAGSMAAALMARMRCNTARHCAGRSSILGFVMPRSVKNSYDDLVTDDLKHLLNMPLAGVFIA